MHRAQRCQDANKIYAIQLHFREMIHSFDRFVGCRLLLLLTAAVAGVALSCVYCADERMKENDKPQLELEQESTHNASTASHLIINTK